MQMTFRAPAPRPSKISGPFLGRGVSHGPKRAARLAAWWLWGLASCACTTQLDPTIPVLSAGAGEGGAAGTPGEPSGDCAEILVGSSKFLICPRAATFDDAQADCQRRGGELAELASALENEALVAASYVLDTQTNLWLGGHRDDQHRWTWPDGSLFWTGRLDGFAPADSFVNWQAGEPNDDSTTSDEPEQCACLTLLDGTWKDRVCGLELSYYCRMPDGAP